MRVKEIRTKGLFGIFDHVIPLNLEDRITIIHGPNGFGKTSILRMVAGVFSANFSALRSLPFDKLEIEFDDGRTLKITKDFYLKHETDVDFPSEMLVEILPEANSQESFTVPKKRFYGPLNHFERFVPGLKRIEKDRWFHRHTGELLDAEEVVERYGDHLPRRSSGRPSRKAHPDWFEEEIGSLNFHYIQTNRLEQIRMTETSPESSYSKTNVTEINVTENIAVEITMKIGAVLAEYAELSQSLDRSFPQRLVTGSETPQVALGDIRAKLDELESRRDELTSAGLLDKNEASKIEFPADDTGEAISEATAPVLSVYIQDADKKLSVFDDLYRRIRLLKEILDRRFAFKTVSIDRHKGLFFVSSNGVELSASNLSSGEQHELVLLYQLLFNVKKDSLILIDEPELSLHVAWQLQFLEDLSQIANLVKFDVLLATHSPQIINDRWDLTVELKGPDACVTS